MPPRAAVTLLACTLLCGSCRSLTKAGDAGTFKAGERAQAGPLIYNVIDSQWNVSLGKGEVPRIPAHRFFIVNLSVVNGGGTEDQSVPTFNLVDDQGNSYPELDNGEGVPEWLGLARRVHPSESLQGNIVFDVEPKHYKLKVTEETDQKYAWIDIPLDFGPPPPSAPPVNLGPAPGGPATRR